MIISKIGAFFKKREDVKILDCLSVDRICFLEAPSRNLALKELVDFFQKKGGGLKDPKEFYKALLEREKIVSTGIGMGIAIPHTKLKSIENFFIVIGILKTGIAWQSLDRVGVRLIFMVGGPEDHQTEYLQLLSQLTQMLKNEEIRKKLLKSISSEEVLHIFENV